jgi:hypothetical protein
VSEPLNVDQVSKADQYLDGEIHNRFISLGKKFFEVFKADEKSGRISTQVRNLQQVVVSATRFADIEDFVKNQMGKKSSASEDWKKVGEEVLRQLNELRTWAAGQAFSDAGQELLLRLHLARGWVRAVVAAYLYAKALKEKDNHG